MQLDPELVATVAVAAAAVAGLLLVVVVLLALRLRALRRSYLAAMGDEPGEDLVAAVATQTRRIQQLAGDVRTVHGNTEVLRELHRRAVSRVGMVRYDAFPDMGGRLSFSAAVLDERGDGIVLSAINGRQETRAYAKGVEAGTNSSHSLSDEERAAIAAALDRERGADLAPIGTGAVARAGRRVKR